jgi:Ca2+-transporting ATPase
MGEAGITAEERVDAAGALPAAPRGLSSAEAAARLAAEGPNELPRPAERTVVRIALEVGREPMFLLLLAAGAIYLLLGSRGEALMLLASALATVAIAVYQESRTERVLEALRNLTSPRALVVRDGERRRIPGREVVRGDVVLLSEGDRVPADAALLSANDLAADESLLTGEAAPVRKVAANGEAAAVPSRPGGDDLPYVFSGSVVVRGQGMGEVRAVGAASEIGRIGRALGEIAEEPTPLHAETRRLVRLLAAVGIGLSTLAVLLYGLLRGTWLAGVLAGITLAMAMLPEEFPLVLTVFLVMGAWRISRQRVLTRRAAAIETLGAATVLCTDKTGTLTANRMEIVELWADGEAYEIPSHGKGAEAELPERFHALVEFGILASEEDPFDPMERAFHELGRRFLAQTEHLHHDWVLAHEYGLSTELLAMSHVWRGAGRDELAIAAKGAPEAIADLCHLDARRLAEVRAATERMAAKGLRVLAVARSSFAGAAWPSSQHDFPFEFLGLVGLADPLRPGVPEAVRECREAGIRVVMVTGDYPATARAIARQAGIAVADDGVVSGEELDRMEAPELARRVRTATVFARTLPEQKLRIVEALKAAGEVVAMTGDGVNDAPALKAAHIGIAMGSRGTDVAREAAAIVLLDDDFGSIVAAIRLGRRIDDNLRKAMGYVLAVHVPIAGLSLLPLLLGWPLVFTPVHIAFLELVIDPVSTIVFEAERAEEDVMRRPPRDPRSRLFSPAFLAASLLQGVLVLALIAGLFAAALHRGLPAPEVRAFTFTALVLADFALVLARRSARASLAVALRCPNAALGGVVLATAALLALALSLPPARALFRFAPLSAAELGLACGPGGLVLVLLEASKVLAPRRRR